MKTGTGLPRQYSLRTILLIAMLGALVLVIAGIGTISLRRLQSSLDNAYRAQRDSAKRQLELRTGDYFETVEQQSAVNHQLFVDGVYSSSDLPHIASHWVSVMRNRLQLTSLSVSLDADGQMLEVARLADGQLSIRHLAPNPATGHLTAKDYWPQDFPLKPYHVIANQDAGDPRGRPWYAAAVSAQRPVWTSTYEFISEGGTENRRGVTHATPFYGKDGKLVGVLTTDVALDDLNRILADLIPPSEGVGLIVERLPDGYPRLLAQSDTGAWSALLPEKMRARLGGDDIGQVLVEKLGTDWSERESLERRIEVPSGSLLLAQVALDNGHLSGERPPWALLMFSPPDPHLIQLQRDLRFVALIIVAVFVIATLLSIWLAQYIARPLATLASQLERFGRLELAELNPGVSAIREVGQLSRSSHSMAVGLRSFLKYVPASLVRQLVAGDEEARLGGEVRQLTIMFVDVQGFTRLAESLSPVELVELLGGINEMLADEIESRHGTLDKFLGDGLMAFWGAPEPMEDHALCACQAALAILTRLAGENEGRVKAGQPALHLRIGIASGPAVVGNFGSTRRISYTAVGNVVNTAAALEQMNKVYGTSVLLDPGVQSQIGDALTVRPVDRLKFKGRQEAMLVCELLSSESYSGRVEALPRLIDGYRNALQDYIAGDWGKAKNGFLSLFASFPGDRPSQVLLERCCRFIVQEPSNWDGAFEISDVSPGSE